MKDHHEFSFPVDESMFDFDFFIYGTITKASVTDVLGKDQDGFLLCYVSCSECARI